MTTKMITWNINTIIYWFCASWFFQYDQVIDEKKLSSVFKVFGMEKGALAKYLYEYIFNSQRCSTFDRLTLILILKP